VGGGFGAGRARTASVKGVHFAILTVVTVGALELFSIKGSGERGIEKLVLKLKFLVDEAAGSGADFLIAFEEKALDLAVVRDNFKRNGIFGLSDENRGIPEAVDPRVRGQRMGGKNTLTKAQKKSRIASIYGRMERLRGGKSIIALLSPGPRRAGKPARLCPVDDFPSPYRDSTPSIELAVRNSGLRVDALVCIVCDGSRFFPIVVSDKFCYRPQG